MDTNNVKLDKLEFLFNQQKELISQSYSKSEIKSEQDGPKTEEGTTAASSPENKMKKLYEIREPFSGYRIFMLSSAMLHEVVELQRETDWKWWKTEKGIENQRIQEEIIDLWHFLIQLSIEAGLEPETLVAKYIEKNKENTKRQQRGY
ncbi:dUTPase [Candidatus Nitrosocosmicus franklandus]|uniref:dUTPase n=1 Tax=Candidatus Nitrosocosmicus franklandianus TaxID=1798806 RepID=UPI001559BC5C|nr:dUTPase [Candidatus Nitrosocosmicus franklandus]